MTEDEKIARWAGFTKRFVYSGGIGAVEVYDKDDNLFANDFGDIEYPDFTDPTTLFKWCVPKLRDLKRPGNYKLGSIHFHDNWNNEGGWLCEINMEQNVDRQSAEVWVTAKQGATPGTALRAAIVALIGEGG